jgi:ATP-dependent Clp protease protease subunit
MNSGMSMGMGTDGGDWSQRLAQRLFEQRVVLLSGTLDDLTGTRAAAELMTLDAEGDAAVSLRIDCGEGSLSVALTLMDVIELLGVPVRALCMGQVGGPAAGVLAVCSHRAAMPSTRFLVREPRTQMEATAREVARWAELRADERQRFCERVALAVGKPAEVVAEDLSRGHFMSATEALAYGLIDEICRPEAEIHQIPGPPIGFRPRH